MNTLYDVQFFEMLERTNYLSAKKISALVYEIFAPKSVVDFGCGVGCWLKAFQEMAENIEILGIDGDWLEGKKVMVSNDKIKLLNVENEIVLEKKYDLAISLEVIEHLSQDKEDIFLTNITNASDVILFSGAIPYQGGRGHINEQRQSYWIEKMEKRGYKCFDFLRNVFWNDEDAGIYRQNIFVFINEKVIDRYEKEINIIKSYMDRVQIYDVVQPYLFEQRAIENIKNRLLFELALKWVNKKNDGFNIADYLRKKSIKTVGIYGMGVLGEAVYNEIKKGGVRIAFATDTFISESNIKEYIKFDDGIVLPNVEGIIITAPTAFSEIKNKLKEHVPADVQIINIIDCLEDD